MYEIVMDIESMKMEENDNQEQNEEKEDSCREEMLGRLIHSSAHFKHQQRGEPELVDEEKHAILTESLRKSPAAFLTRYGHFLKIDDLKYFERYSADYEVNFRIKELRDFLTHQERIVKNRRYEAVKRLMVSGEYFSEDEMKHREPLLYEEMVGRYLSHDDVVIDKSDLRLSSVLMDHIVMKQDNILYALQKELQDGQVEEEESSDDEASGDGGDRSATGTMRGAYTRTLIDTDTAEERGQLSAEELGEIRQDFLRTMQERFLIGCDKKFDYRSVDYNSEYDPVNQQERDEEERYFMSDDDS